MHDYSIVQSLVERVDAEVKSRGASSVHRVSIRIGELSCLPNVRLDAIVDALDRVMPRPQYIGISATSEVG